MMLRGSEFDIRHWERRFAEAKVRMSQAVTIALQDDMRRSSIRPKVRGFFDARTYSVQYVVSDPHLPTAHRCAIIDPVLDFDEKSGSTVTRSADAILDYLTVDWILDTHPHADHFSPAGYLKDVTGAPTAIGERVVDVQRLWKALYNLPDSFPTDGSLWDHPLRGR
jgi:glyoxylase-like metal-dependent hydrolase (beta-lactamase superfamily II)